MPKELWKIKNFSGGLNDFTDAKDLEDGEFANVTDANVSKKGQIKNGSGFSVSSDIQPVNLITGVDTTGNGSEDTSAGLIPGKGFFKSPNDYDVTNTRSAGATVVLENTTPASNGAYASCAFEVNTCLFLFSALEEINGDFDWSFRLESKESANILPAGSAGFDVASGTWNIIENWNQGGEVSFLDDSNITINGHSYVTTNIANEAWSITPEIEEIIGIDNARVLGGARNKAVGFYKYTGISEYDDYVGELKFPWYENQTGTVQQSNITYELMRDSFCTKLTALINSVTSTPNVTASYEGIGTGKITLTAADLGTTLNDYQISATMLIANTVSATADTAGSILTSSHSNTPVKSAGGHFNISGQTTFRGGSGPLSEVWRLKISGSTANMDLVTISVFMRDDTFAGDIQDSPFQFTGTHVDLGTAIHNAVNSHSVLGSKITSALDTSNSDYTYVTLTADTTGAAGGFTVLYQTNPRDGFFDSAAANEQHLLITHSDKDFTDVGIPNGRDIYGQDLTGEYGLYPNLESQIGSGANNIFGIFFNIYSPNSGTWSIYNGNGNFHPTNNLGESLGSSYSQSFDWVWSAEHNQNPEPTFFNNGNICIFSDGNFQLPNYNMFFGYVDRSAFFKDAYDPINNISANPFGPAFSKLRKWIKYPSRKTWSFTNNYYYGAKNPKPAWGNQEENYFGVNYGVRVRADGYYNSNLHVGGEEGDNFIEVPNPGAMCEFRIIKRVAYEDNVDLADWGGVEPTEEVEDPTDTNTSAFKHYSFYVTAMYDDGSESLPTHRFLFSDGNADNEFHGSPILSFNWNEVIDRINIHMRPMTEACRDALLSGGVEANNPEILGQMCFPDPRVKGLRLYYTDSDEDHEIFWHLTTVDFEKGMKSERGKAWSQWRYYNQAVNEGYTDYMFIQEDWGSVQQDLFTKPKGRTYEFFNGFDPKYNDDVEIRFKHATHAGNRMFIGNIEVSEWVGDNSNYANQERIIKKVYNDRMVMSEAGKLDNFNRYPNNVFDLNISDGDEITGLASTASKLLQFKRGTLYIVDIASGDPATFFISDTFKLKGIDNPNHFCQTTEGVFFFNEYGAWIYDGEELKDVFVNTDDQDKKQQRIDPDTWKAFVNTEAQCEFNARTNEVFIVKSNNQITMNSSGNSYIYNIYTDAWVFGRKTVHVEHSSGVRAITNFSHIGKDLGLCYLGRESTTSDGVAKLFLLDDYSDTSLFKVTTKVTDLGDPRSFKSILGLVISVVQASSNSAYMLSVYWRQGDGFDWAPLSTISNSDADDTQEGLVHTHMFAPITVKGIRMLQLKIEGDIQGEFGINDISLIFRKYKSDDINIFTAEND